MKNQFVFENSDLTPKCKSDAVVNSINMIIRHKTPDHFIPYIQLKAVLNKFDTPVVLNNAYRGIEHDESDFDIPNKPTAIKIYCGLSIYGESDYDFYVTEATTINVYCGLTICIYKFRTGDKNNKSGFYYIEEKTIDPMIPDDSHNITEAPEEKNNTKLERTISMKNNIKNNFGIDDATVECIRASLANTDVRLDVLADVFGIPLIKVHDICVAFNCRPVPKSTATEVKKPEEPSKPTNEPEFVKAMENSKPKQKDADMVKNMLKMRDYFEINRIITDNFDSFVDTSIVPLTEYLKSIRDVICKKVISQSGNSLLGNLSVEEIDKYIRPFSYLITLIDIEEPEKAAYMIKSGFNALLLAHMDARINGLDEDLHVDYTVK